MPRAAVSDKWFYDIVSFEDLMELIKSDEICSKKHSNSMPLSDQDIKRLYLAYKIKKNLKVTNA